MLEFGRLRAAFLLTSALIYGWLGSGAENTTKADTPSPKVKAFFVPNLGYTSI